jgi:hypothetical protein
VLHMHLHICLPYCPCSMLRHLCACARDLYPSSLWGSYLSTVSGSRAVVFAHMQVCLWRLGFYVPCLLVGGLWRSGYSASTTQALSSQLCPPEGVDGGRHTVRCQVLYLGVPSSSVLRSVPALSSVPIAQSESLGSGCQGKQEPGRKVGQAWRHWSSRGQLLGLSREGRAGSGLYAIHPPSIPSLDPSTIPGTRYLLNATSTMTRPETASSPARKQVCASVLETCFRL